MLIEVKNEKTTRGVIGQAVEYLSQYAAATLEDIKDEYTPDADGKTVESEFLGKFHRKLAALKERRRVVVVAPGFDDPSALAPKYLSDQMGPRDITFHLIKAIELGRDSGGKCFDLQVYRPPDLVKASDMPVGAFGQSRAGRLFCVLETGKDPILWNVGMTRDGNFKLPAENRRLLLRGGGDRKLIRFAKPQNVDLGISGKMWKRRKKPGWEARLIGCVRSGRSSGTSELHAIFVRFRDDRPAKLRRQKWSSFEKDWEESQRPAPGWAACVRSLEAGGLGGPQEM